MRLFCIFVATLLLVFSNGNSLEQSQERAENNCKTLMDLFIVLDSSGSVGQREFEEAKTALVDLVSRLQIGPKKVHVWIINYGEVVETPVQFVNIPIAEFTKETLARQIKGIQYMNGACTATGSALARARAICGERCRGLNEGVSRVALVLTDGNSNCGASVATESSQLLHITRASVFAVGIGSYINNVELQTIATAKNYVMHVNNYLELTSAINNITLQTCGIPAFVVPNVKVETTVPSDTYRYYQLDTTELLAKNRNSGGGFVEIIANIRQGRIQAYTSTTNSNPGPNTGRRVSFDARAGEQYYMEYIEENVPRLYISFYGADTTNEYDFILQWLDMNGNTIG